MTSLFDVTLPFALEGPRTDLIHRFPSVPTPSGDFDMPSLSTALQEQLRLMLESGGGPVEAVVIDRSEKQA